MDSSVLLIILLFLLLPPLIVLAGVYLAYRSIRKQFNRGLDQVSEDLRRRTAAQLEAGGLPATDIESEVTRVFSGVGNRILLMADENGLDLDAAKKRFFERTNSLAVWMDSKFVLPGGFRFGADPVIGLVPVVGDILTTAASVIVLINSLQYGLPGKLIIRMVANIGLDYVVGLTPVAGDVFDLFFKANKRNMALLQEHIESTEIRRSAA